MAAHDAPGAWATDDPFERDARGRTRLHYAAEQGHVAELERITDSLPGTGFYPRRLSLIEVKDGEGLTAADVAERAGHTAAAELLRYKAWAAETFG